MGGSAGLQGFNVLVAHSKGLTPPQQAWPPLTLEGFAQLEVRRAVKRSLGLTRCVCWTDHATGQGNSHVRLSSQSTLLDGCPSLWLGRRLGGRSRAKGRRLRRCSRARGRRLGGRHYARGCRPGGLPLRRSSPVRKPVTSAKQSTGQEC